MKNFDAIKDYPMWFKWAMVLLAVVLIYNILKYLQFIFMPLAPAALLAILLEPLCKQFEKLKIGRIASILLSMLVVLCIFVGIGTLFSIQLAQFGDKLPMAGKRLEEISNNIVHGLQGAFGISPEQQVEYLKRGLQNILSKSGQYVTGAVGITTSIFLTLLLLPIFLFFLLYYKPMFYNFIFHAVGKGKDGSLKKMIQNIQKVTNRYILGLIGVVSIVAALQTLGLWIIGLDQPVFFGVFAAILAIIPYIGIIIGALPAVLYAVIFGGSLWMPVKVIIVYTVVQFSEGHFITPTVVGSRVNVNPFMALIALLIAGRLWGIVGMIISVPSMGILKSIFDEIEGLRPYGYLLGHKVEYVEYDENTEEQ